MSQETRRQNVGPIRQILVALAGNAIWLLAVLTLGGTFKAVLATHKSLLVSIAAGLVAGAIPFLARYTWRQRAKRRLGEKQQLSNDIKRFQRIIRNLAEAHRRAYHVKDTVEWIIEPDGSSVARRTREIVALDEVVSWIDMEIGCTVPRPKEEGVRLHVPQFSDRSGRTLDTTEYEESDRAVRYLVFLHEPVRRPGTELLTFQERREKSWAPLLRDLEDHGSYKAENFVESVALTVRVPPELRIDSFSVTPQVGSVTVRADKTEATWQATSLPADTEYRYRVRCLKTASAPLSVEDRT